MEKKSKKTKILKSITCIILLAVMLFFGGCFADAGGGEGASFIGGIQGFKVNYRPKSYNYLDYYKSFAQTTLEELFETFYYNANNDNSAIVDDEREQKYAQMAYNQKYGEPVDKDVDKDSEQWKEYVVYYFSDIHYSTKMLTNANGSPIDPAQNPITSDFYYTKSNISWKWDTSQTDSHALNDGAKQSRNVILYYNNEVVRDVRQNLVTDLIIKPLQVATLQIVLGKTPTVFNQSNFSTAGNILGSATLVGGNVQANGLMNELVTKGSYVGISQDALAKIKEYILTNVIGSQKFSETNPDNYFSKDDYAFILDQIWAKKQNFHMKNTLNIDDETDYGCVFDIYPATALQDFPSNAFFVNSSDNQAFQHIQKAEYQSIVIMPNKQQYLEEIWFYLASDRQMTVNYYTRSFDAKTGLVSVGPVKQVKTNIESEFVYEEASHGTVTFYKNSEETIVRTEKFNNDIGGGIINTNGQAVAMTYPMSKYFIAVPSLNGFGSVSVLNHQKFAEADGCSFIEIVFDVQKDGDDDKDYSFKVGMSYYGMPSQSEIVDFLIENNQ
mgnify:CR=1 FL=1